MSVVANVSLNVDTRGVPQKLREVQNQAQQTEKAFNGIAAAAGKLALAFAGLQAAKFIFGKAAELESQARSLEVLTGSAQKAAQIIRELQQLGAVTPFTSTELIDAAKRLQAFGVEANKVVETTRRLADVSGATGAELQGLVTAYGQVQAKGRLQGEELLQFQERGVALQEELRKMYKLSGDEFQSALSKGQISAEAVEIAIQRLTAAGGKYANGAIAQSDTLQGKLSTLQDSFEQLARNIGSAFAPVFKFLIDGINDLIQRINNASRLGAEARAYTEANRRTRARFGARAVNPFDQEVQQYRERLRRSLVTSEMGVVGGGQRGAAAPSTVLPPLLGARGGGGGRGGAANEAKRLADELRRSVEEGDQLGRELSRQVVLLGNLSESERERQQIQFRYEDDVRRINQLKDQEQKTNLIILANERRRLELEKVRTEELKKQAAEYIKLIPIFAQFQEDLGALAFTGGPDQAGIGIDIGQAFGLSRALTDTENSALAQAKKALDDLIEPANQVKSVATSIGGAFTDSFRSVIDGSMTAQEALSGFFNRIANAFLDMAAQIITQLIVIKALESSLSIFGGGFKGFSGAGPVSFPSGMNIGLAGFRANGGSVRGGSAYMVGERGPELFVPGRSGMIVANDQLGGANVVVNVDASGSNVQNDAGQAGQLGKAIGIAVQQELIKQKRPGGLLA